MDDVQSGAMCACDETGLNATWISNSKKREGEITKKDDAQTLHALLATRRGSA
jgi:hypothetical protein